MKRILVKSLEIVLLDLLGLKIIQLTADGNCFFRALADQLEANEEAHEKYRSMVVQYIMKNREMFEPFFENDVPFDEYCQSMEKDGTWAGHLEFQAASLVTRTNICIHQSMSPRWYIRNFNNRGARKIHLQRILGVEGEKSKARKVELLKLQLPSGLMDCCRTWVHFVFDHDLRMHIFCWD